MVVFIFFCFKRETLFLGKFSLKFQYCQFKQKFGPYTISNMQNSMAVFTFAVLEGKHHFGQIWTKKHKVFSFR